MASKGAGRRSRGPVLGAALVVIAVSLTGFLACNGDSLPDTASVSEGVVWDTGGFGLIVECQHEWTSIYANNSSDSGLAGIDRITDVPEFHDCQKMLRPDGSYGPLIAVFAAWELDTLDIRLARESGNPVPAKPADVTLERGALTARQASGATGGSAQQPPASPSTQSSATVTKIGRLGALILNFDEAYVAGNLVIQPGYNCLYLWLAPQWNARIVPVKDDDECLKPIIPDTVTAGVLLTVREDWGAGGGRDDYPAVARWDYDTISGQQYIGIKCGAAWCEVGSSTFKPSVRYEQAAGIPEGIRRVRRIKGWYDEQYLAVAQADTSLAAAASRLKGTIIPHPLLDTYTDPDFEIKWAPVAYVALEGGQGGDAAHYKAKVNLELASPTLPVAQLNQVAMCHGTLSQCNVVPDPTKKCFSDPQIGSEPRWWVRITAATSQQVKYRCIVRRPHPALGKHVPGTARWRWVLKDETKWVRCVEGCCEVDNSAT